MSCTYQMSRDIYCIHLFSLISSGMPSWYDEQPSRSARPAQARRILILTVSYGRRGQQDIRSVRSIFAMARCSPSLVHLMEWNSSDSILQSSFFESEVSATTTGAMHECSACCITAFCRACYRACSGTGNASWWSGCEKARKRG